jgi:hypothetical protein
MARIAALCAVLLFTCCCDGNVYSDGAGKSFNKHDGYVALGLGWSGLFSLNGRCDDSIHVPAWCVLHGEHSSCTLHRSARSTASHRFVRLTAQLVTSPCWLYFTLSPAPCAAFATGKCAMVLLCPMLRPIDYALPCTMV